MTFPGEPPSDERPPKKIDWLKISKCVATRPHVKNRYDATHSKAGRFPAFLFVMVG